MVTVKIAEVVGAALDWLVAKCEGWPERDALMEPFTLESIRRNTLRWCDEGISWAENWKDAGPIIERMMRGHSFFMENDGEAAHVAYSQTPHDNSHGVGPSPLIAAMRCYVASKMGDTVEVPAELMP